MIHVRWVDSVALHPTDNFPYKPFPAELALMGTPFVSTMPARATGSAGA